MISGPVLADLCDAHAGRVQVAVPGLRDYGGVEAFAGPIVTVRCHEDNSLVRAALEANGEGRVLVVDGGGSLRCALLGDKLVALGIKNGWRGAVIWGCVRDSAILATLPFGVKALGVHPLRSTRHGWGESEVALNFAGVSFLPGAWLYADRDGLLVAASPLAP